jgi:hypothetical protein
VTSPNPFDQQAPQQPADAGNPFGGGVPTEPPVAPAQQGWGAPAQQPVQAYAPAAPPAAYAPPAQQGFGPAQQPVQAYAPPQQQPQYAPAPQAQPAATAAPSGPPPALDPNAVNAAGAPPPAGDGRGAKLADMYNRLVLFFPHGITNRARNPQYITPEQRQRGQLTEDVLTATAVVLDSGPGTQPGTGFIDFGGAPYKMPPTAHTDREQLPYVRKAMWITQTRLVGQLRDFLPQPGQTVPGMCAGRVVKAGPQANDPWQLQGATAEELATCQAYLRLVSEGRYPHPLA